MNISEDILCLYNATVEYEDDSYVLEVPEQEIQNGDLSDDEVYKIALIATSPDGTETTRGSSEREQTVESESGPPVDEGDIRKVEIEGVGDQGDGVGKIAGGYVVIVPETEPGDTVTAEMETVREKFAIAQVTTSGFEDHSL
jgi:predicted RNA-binding protein with TRAM domain